MNIYHMGNSSSCCKKPDKPCINIDIECDNNETEISCCCAHTLIFKKHKKNKKTESSSNSSNSSK